MRRASMALHKALADYAAPGKTQAFGKLHAMTKFLDALTSILFTLVLCAVLTIAGILMLAWLACVGIWATGKGIVLSGAAWMGARR